MDPTSPAETTNALAEWQRVVRARRDVADRRQYRAWRREHGFATLAAIDYLAARLNDRNPAVRFITKLLLTDLEMDRSIGRSLVPGAVAGSAR